MAGAAIRVFLKPLALLAPFALLSLLFAPRELRAEVPGTGNVTATHVQGS